MMRLVTAGVMVLANPLPGWMVTLRSWPLSSTTTPLFLSRWPTAQAVPSARP